MRSIYLVNNAGVMAVKNYTTSKDGIESQFAACDVGHYLLTNLLIKEILVVGDGATIVNVASLGYLLAEANLEDPNFEVGVMTFFDGCPAKQMKILTRSQRRMEKRTVHGRLMARQRPQTCSSLWLLARDCATGAWQYLLYSLVVSR